MSDARRRAGAGGGTGLVDRPLQPQLESERVTDEERGNLSLFPETDLEAEASGPDAPAPESLSLPFGQEDPAAEEPGAPPGDEEDGGEDGVADEDGSAGGSEAPELVPASFVHRLLAGLADLVVHLAVLAGGVTAMALLGLEPRLEDAPGILVFVFAFSFLYTVVPLAFWGQTPGMAWGGTRALDRGHRPLTFGQTGMRWLGGLLTGALFGLPFVTALFGPSPADLLSGSRTFRASDAEASEAEEDPSAGG